MIHFVIIATYDFLVHVYVVVSWKEEQTAVTKYTVTRFGLRRQTWINNTRRYQRFKLLQWILRRYPTTRNFWRTLIKSHKFDQLIYCNYIYLFWRLFLLCKCLYCVGIINENVFCMWQACSWCPECWWPCTLWTGSVARTPSSVVSCSPPPAASSLSSSRKVNINKYRIPFVCFVYVQ